MPTPFPDAEGARGRHEETRKRNARIAEAAVEHRFSRSVAVPFICECSNERCEALVRLTLPDYWVARDTYDYLVSPGHQVEGAKIVRIKESVWLYRVG